MYFGIWSGFRRPLHAYIKSKSSDESGGRGEDKQLGEGGSQEGKVEVVGVREGGDGMETEAVVGTESKGRREEKETQLVKKDGASSSQCDSVEQESLLDRTSGE